MGRHGFDLGADAQVGEVRRIERQRLGKGKVVPVHEDIGTGIIGDRMGQPVDLVGHAGDHVAFPAIEAVADHALVLAVPVRGERRPELVGNERGNAVFEARLVRRGERPGVRIGAESQLPAGIGGLCGRRARGQENEEEGEPRAARLPSDRFEAAHSAACATASGSANTKSVEPARE